MDLADLVEMRDKGATIADLGLVVPASRRLGVMPQLGTLAQGPALGVQVRGTLTHTAPP
jgi:hypothetical protein